MKPSTITEGSVSRHLDNVTIVIKTFERAKSVRMLMESLRLFYPFVPVIVIDDSREPLDAAWCDDNTTYVHTEYDIGLSEGRNRGVDLSKTEFTFIADDDFVFTPASRLDLLLKPLQNSGFCVAGSRMINYGHDEVMFHGSFGSDGTTLYHRAECLTHVGDSQAVRSLTQCGEPMRFAMAAPIDLRNDFDSVSLRRLGRGPGTRPRAVVCWRWPRSTMVAAGRMRRGSAASVCRSFATGCCASTPADRTGWSMGSHRAHPRSSTPITAAHWRRLLRPARSRRSTASCAGGARTWRGGSWRRSPSRSTRPRSGAS